MGNYNYNEVIAENEQSHIQQLLDMGIPSGEIEFSRRCAMHPLDVALFREVSLQGYLIIIRCPKASSWKWQGEFAAKPWAVKQKTGAWGTVKDVKGRRFVSDYDLMSVWFKKEGGKFSKLFISAAAGKNRGPWSKEAQAFIVRLNKQLKARIQHGCQDDFVSEKDNPGIKREDRFVAFEGGYGAYLPNMDSCRSYYADRRLVWLYDNAGKFDYAKAKEASKGW